MARELEVLGSKPEGVWVRAGWKAIDRNAMKTEEYMVNMLQSPVCVPCSVQHEKMMLTKAISRVESVIVGVGDVVASSRAVTMRGAFA
jgi:hypothetical protein